MLFPDRIPTVDYEKFRTAIPKIPLGFRGQSNVYLQKTLTEGFDIPRPYYAFNFARHDNSLSAEDYERFMACFGESMGYGQTRNGRQPSLLDGDKFTADAVLSYFTERPEEYTSVLVLHFPGELSERFCQRPILYKGVIGFHEETLPAVCIVRALTLQAEDFKQAQKELKTCSTDWEPKRHMVASNFLKERLFGNYLQVIAGLGVPK